MVVLRFHLEVTPWGDAFWTAGSPQIPSLRAQSSRLRDCQRMAIDVLNAADVDTTHMTYELADPV
jgi:hypothetical protein